MDFRDADLEGFLLRGRLQGQKDFSRPAAEIVDVKVGEHNFEEASPNLNDETAFFLVESTKQSESLEGAADGSSPSRLMKWLTIWSWVWGGSKYSGSACMAISAAAYSLMGLFVKLLAVRSIPSSQIIMFRCTFVSLVSGLALRRLKHPLLGTPRVRRFVFARAVVGCISLFAYFYSIQMLPLRDATVLNFTSPVFTVILATVFLNETWSFVEAAGTFCSFFGVLLVTQPQMFFAGHSGSEITRDLYVGAASALVAAALGALSYIFVRIIGQHGEPPLVSVFAFAAFSTPMAALGIIFQGFHAVGAGEVALLLLIGVLAYCAQICLTRALQLEKASSVAPIQFVKVSNKANETSNNSRWLKFSAGLELHPFSAQVLFTLILGVLFLHEIPTLKDILGAVLIVGSAAMISHKSSSS